MSDIEHIQDTLQCAVCRDLLIEPITLSCQHTFCRACLIADFKNKKCPLCNAISRGRVEDILSGNENVAIKELLIHYCFEGEEEKYKKRVEEKRIAYTDHLLRLWQELSDKCGKNTRHDFSQETFGHHANYFDDLAHIDIPTFAVPGQPHAALNFPDFMSHAAQPIPAWKLWRKLGISDGLMMTGTFIATCVGLAISPLELRDKISFGITITLGSGLVLFQK